MIYTLTMNPSLDYHINLPQLETGKVNRSQKEYIQPGGKGINVSRVLWNLGVANEAFCCTAGFTGNMLEQLLAQQEIRGKFFRAREGLTRINVKIHGTSETDINGRGPVMDRQELDRLCEELHRLKSGDYLVLSGNVPPGVTEHFYADILCSVAGRGIRTVVDAEGELLGQALEEHPFLIKPNLQELSRLLHADLQEDDIDFQIDRVVSCGEELCKRGAGNVLISMGKRGAILLTDDGKRYRAKAPEGVQINSVGAGDSMVAGFLAGYEKSGSYEEALRYGVCAGSASAFSEQLATAEEIQQLLEAKGAGERLVSRI